MKIPATRSGRVNIFYTLPNGKVKNHTEWGQKRVQVTRSICAAVLTGATDIKIKQSGWPEAKPVEITFDEASEWIDANGGGAYGPMLREVLSSHKKISREQDYILRREIDAIEKGHKAVREPDGTYSVWSDSEPAKYSVEAIDYAGLLQTKCNCKGGQKKRWSKMIPCWHGAKVARRLEREGLVYWQNGHFFWKEPAKIGPDDPFEGI